MRHVGFAHPLRHALAAEGRQQEKERGREQRHAPRGGEQAPFARPRLCGDLALRAARSRGCGVGLGRKAEISRFEPHGEHHQRERNQRIDVGNDAVSLRLEHPREDGREQVAQKTHRNGADTVNGGLFGQLFKHLFSIAPAHKAFYPAKIRISESNVKFICFLPRRSTHQASAKGTNQLRHLLLRVSKKNVTKGFLWCEVDRIVFFRIFASIGK